MKRITFLLTAIFALALFGCTDVDKANDKVSDCLEEEYGESEAEKMLSEWELDCDKDEEDCKNCAECYLDEECDALLDGACDEKCAGV
jgi:tetrahydromethanopterin S-methyltransferase subunit A